MDKTQTLAFIQEQLTNGKISKEDLVRISESHTEEISKNLINVFYIIGALVAVVGVAILVGQNWDLIGFVGRILVSLGFSVLAYGYALFLTQPTERVLSQVMYVVSAVLAPLGVYVLLHQANVSFGWVSQLYTAFVLCMIFGYALWATRKNVLVLIILGFATWAYYTLLLNAFVYEYGGNLLEWSAIFLGCAYVLIGYGNLRVSATEISLQKEKTLLATILYILGTMFVLGAGISIGGVFDIFFIGFIFAAFYTSVYIKSKSMLALGALFLIADIIKLTSKYFVDSIGWPLALIIVGCCMIGIGYMTFTLNKKYISLKS